MLEVEVKKRLGDLTVEASFNVRSRGVTAVFGSSGAGKTSVINMIAGLVTPDEGRVALDGDVFFDSSGHRNVPAHKRGVGYVFQDARLFPHMSVEKNLLYGSARRSSLSFEADMGSVCSLLGIEKLLKRNPSKLSGGEKQRVAIGRALLSNPRILLMDEPLASLDAARRAELLDYISVIPRDFDIPIVYVSHSTDEILKLADEMVLMENGKAIKYGPAIDILNESAFARNRLEPDFGVVCEGRVASYDAKAQLAVVDFGGGKAEIAAERIIAGSVVRFRINAVDVVLCASEPPATSVRNVYAGKVIKTSPRSDHLTDVLVDIGIPVWARITSRSAEDLGSVPGSKVYVLIKSAALSTGVSVKN